MGNKMKYICPKCHHHLNLETSLTGWELESVDPETGETVELLLAERCEIHNITYICSYDFCDWEGDESYFEGEE